jgi:hypothetical protein
MAQYRTKRYKEALVTLTRSDQINSKIHKVSQPADLPFLAMTQCRPGKKVEAQATLARLHQATKVPGSARNQDNAAFQREAEALLREKKTP